MNPAPTWTVGGTHVVTAFGDRLAVQYERVPRGRFLLASWAIDLPVLGGRRSPSSHFAGEVNP